MSPDRLAIICAALPALINKGEIGDVCIAAAKKLADELASPDPLPPVLVNADDPTLRLLFAYFYAAEDMTDPIITNSPTKFGTVRQRWEAARQQLKTHLQRLGVDRGR
jgi:hypothetical protein